jgi:hypothetical protein
MHVRRRTTAAVAALGAAVAGSLVAAAPATAAAAQKVPVVAVHISSSAIHLSTGNHLHSGRILFRVYTGKGDHTLQIARLHQGYSLQQAGSDLGKAFQGNVPAIRRVDHNITFRGGAETRPHHPGSVAIRLPAGRFLFTDQNSNAVTFVTVTGDRFPRRAGVPHQSEITLFTYGFGTTPASIPATGWTKIGNQSDQPHFVVFNRVKQGTTPAMVRRYFKSGSQANPPWGLRANYGSGVLSPNYSQVMHYSLPRGEYLMACWWPDDDTGMPHAYMGMWKLIQLT